ncbi:hypothetical protein COO60DRAFT_516835 [Scenedesmus sp. NREL 46B-D3]|nr:hypothetical protein COO60DRAFT_516835 [Scenedesmus sp. NREL 46B-D3]
MSADTCDVRVQSSPEPQERHSSSPPCKGSQRCISIHANVDAASSGLMELVHGQVHATSHGISQNISMRAPQGSCGVVYDAVMELHIREDHPEHPNRIKELSSRLEREGLLGKCTRLTPKLATDEELLKCHSKAHIDRVDGLYSNAITTEGRRAEQVGDAFIISEDIYCNRHTSMAARSAAGCCVQAVHAVMAGQVRTAFAIVRPPGHHAESQELMGFCFFNNVAVAAHAALEQPGMERVLILDWDIHHGNGTQQIFQEDPRVLVVSLHRRDGNFYPQGCGYANEVGKGPGRGFNVNVPWTSKGMGDADYLAAFDLLLDPIITQFNPQLVLISAGFDAVDGDFLGRCHVSPPALLP